MNKEEKEKKFIEFYTKFIRKCLTENLLPVPVLKYEQRGIFPIIDFQEVSEEQKEEVLSSLDKKQ